MSKKKAAYYVVWSGHVPGVYDNWADCEQQVKGFEVAKYKGFASQAEAERALHESPEKYILRKAGSTEKVQSPTNPILPALAVDAACSGNPGVM